MSDAGSSASDDLPTDVGNGRLADGGGADTFTWALRSHPGELRPNNEDFAGMLAPEGDAAAWSRAPLFVVADGMGGHAAGEVASRVAVTSALEHWGSAPVQQPQPALRSALRSANLAVYDTSLTNRTFGMGTTVVAASFFGREVVVAHVGDSRAYLVHQDRCMQLTSDHSRVAEMVRMKLITPEQAANHPARSMLTRTLGNDPVVQVDFNSHPVQRGDVLVLCSDGLWDVVSRADLVATAAAVAGGDDPPGQAADALIEQALKRGAPDNVTALVIDVTTDKPFPLSVAKRSLFGRRHA